MSSAAEIINGLGGNPRTGMCKCPAHDDAKPSLHVSDGHKGVVFHCHAGCSQDQVIAALQRRGLWLSGGQNRVKPTQHIDDREDALKEALQEYENFRRAYKFLYAAMDAKAKEGAPAEYFRRRNINIVPPCAMLLPPSKSAEYLGKRTRTMVCPITDGKVLIGTHTTLLTPDAKEKLATETPRKSFGRVKGGYVMLSELDANKPLVIGEGIESTLSAMQLSGVPGIAAVSAVNMTSINPPKCTEVIIAADNDDPGRKAAAQLAQRLEYEGHKVRIATPRAEGADWNDRLLESDKVQDEWRAALAADNREAAGPISALEEDEFMNLAFPQRQRYLDPWLPSPGLVMVHAPRGEGKTWFALGVGKAVAAGRDFLGWSCPNDARVLYLDGELPGADLQERLDKFRRSPPGMFHVLCRDTFLLGKQLMPDLGEQDGRDELDRIIERCQPDLVILDSISTLVRSGAENEAESWAPIQEWLQTHRWQSRTIMLIHHQGKSGQQRGTSKREDVLDTVIKLEKLTGDDTDDGTDGGTVFKLTFTKTRDFFGRDAEPLRLRLSINGGQVLWGHETVRSSNETKVRELLAAGEKQADIAKELGLSPGYISQIAKRSKSVKVNADDV